MTQRSQGQCIKSIEGIERSDFFMVNQLELPVEDESLSYSVFINKYLKPNRPVMIRDIAVKWDVYHKWTHVVNEARTVNEQALTDSLKGLDAPISTKDGDCHTSKCEDYFAMWSNGTRDYLKDFHFVKETGVDVSVLNRLNTEPAPYKVPIFFEDDWMNDFSARENDDYRFVYIGPPGSSTLRHADVLASHSWSVNLCGRKLWTFYIPSPSNSEEMEEWVIEQGPGDAIFVPSELEHMVINLDHCVSVNHNWCNGSNFGRVAALVAADWVHAANLMLMEEFDGSYNDRFTLVSTVVRANGGLPLLEFGRWLVRVLDGLPTSHLAQCQCGEGLPTCTPCEFKEESLDLLKSHSAVVLDAAKDIIHRAGSDDGEWLTDLKALIEDFQIRHVGECAVDEKLQKSWVIEY